MMTLEELNLGADQAASREPRTGMGEAVRVLPADYQELGLYRAWRLSMFYFGGAEMITTFSAEELIDLARENPPEPIIDGLLFKGDICLVHGQEESFKSIWVFQMANIASGTPLLRRFGVPTPRRVGVIETELHDSQLGERLARMSQNRNPPNNLRILGAMKEFRAARSMDTRLNLVRNWAQQEGIEVLFLDIASDFFRGQHSNPTDERSVAPFFEQLRDMQLTCAVVRHDHKPRMEDTGDGNSNNRVRGSGEWKEDPEVVLWLAREDMRTNEVALEVGKLRYGSKPEPMKPWFDAGPFRLTLLPPVVAVLEQGPCTRRDLVAGRRVAPWAELDRDRRGTGGHDPDRDSEWGGRRRAV